MYTLLRGGVAGAGAEVAVRPGPVGLTGSVLHGLFEEGGEGPIQFDDTSGDSLGPRNPSHDDRLGSLFSAASVHRTRVSAAPAIYFCTILKCLAGNVRGANRRRTHKRSNLARTPVVLAASALL